jgi:hypothetical protein
LVVALGFVPTLAAVAMPANRAAVLNRIAPRRVGVVWSCVAVGMDNSPCCSGPYVVPLHKIRNLAGLTSG